MKLLNQTIQGQEYVFSERLEKWAKEKSIEQVFYGDNSRSGLWHFFGRHFCDVDMQALLIGFAMQELLPLGWAVGKRGSGYRVFPPNPDARSFKPDERNFKSESLVVALLDAMDFMLKERES